MERKSWERRASTALVVIACLSTALPLALGGPFLPFHDHPGHMAIAHIEAHIDEPARHLGERWQLEPRLLPNAVYHALVSTLARTVDVVVVDRVFLIALCALALPLALLAWLRVHRRDERFAVVGAALVFHWGLTYGFVQWAQALPIVFALLALRTWRRRCSGTRAAVVDVVIAAGSAFVWLCHAFGWLVIFGAVLVLAAIETRRWRDLVTDAALVLPGGTLFFLWIAQRESSTSDSQGVSGLFASLPAMAASIVPFGQALRDVVPLSIGFSRHAVHVPLAVGLMLAFLALCVQRVLASRGERELEHDVDERRAGVALGVLAVAFWVGYFVFPVEIRKPLYWFGISPRLLVPAIATTFVALAPRRASSSSFVPTATAALLALVVIVHDGLVLRDVRRFNEVDMAGFAEVVDAIPEAARVLPVLSHQSSAYVVTPFPHMGSYAVIRRDAQVPHGLMHTRDFVVQWRQRFPAIPWGDPRRVRDAELLREYDFVLVRHPPGSRFRRFGDAPPERLVSVIERGDFSLLRVATPSEQR